MTDAVMINGITVEQFEDSLRKIVREEIAGIQQPNSYKLGYRTKSETAKILNITLPTLDKLVRNGRIKGLRLGGRVLFADADIQAALKEIPAMKYQRR